VWQAAIGDGSPLSSCLVLKSRCGCGDNVSGAPKIAPGRQGRRWGLTSFLTIDTHIATPAPAPGGQGLVNIPALNLADGPSLRVPECESFLFLLSLLTQPSADSALVEQPNTADASRSFALPEKPAIAIVDADLCCHNAPPESDSPDRSAPGRPLGRALSPPAASLPKPSAQMADFAFMLPAISTLSTGTACTIPQEADAHLPSVVPAYDRVEAGSLGKVILTTAPLAGLGSSSVAPARPRIIRPLLPPPARAESVVFSARAPDLARTLPEADENGPKTGALMSASNLPVDPSSIPRGNDTQGEQNDPLNILAFGAHTPFEGQHAPPRDLREGVIQPEPSEWLQLAETPKSMEIVVTKISAADVTRSSRNERPDILTPAVNPRLHMKVGSSVTSYQTFTHSAPVSSGSHQEPMGATDQPRDSTSMVSLQEVPIPEESAGGLRLAETLGSIEAINADASAGQVAALSSKKTTLSEVIGNAPAVPLAQAPDTRIAGKGREEKEPGLLRMPADESRMTIPSDHTAELHLVAPYAWDSGENGRFVAARTAEFGLLLNDTQLLDQLKEGILKASQFSRMTVHLRPPDLGAVVVAVESRGGELHAHFRAAHPFVQTWLEMNVGALRSHLAGAGLALQDITLSTSYHQQSGSRDPQLYLAPELVQSAEPHVARNHVSLALLQMPGQNTVDCFA